MSEDDAVVRSCYRRSGRTLRAFAGVSACLVFAGLTTSVCAQDASTAVYFRTDSDQTTVVTPRLRVGGDIADATRLDVSYAVDVWTSASIDIRTSASKAVTEQRDEINVGLARQLGDTTLNAGYRFSSEPDYTSHGGSLGVSSDFAERNTTLALSLSAYFDTVGRVGAPVALDASARTYSARASFTQVLGPDTFAQLIYELGHAQGFLSSPYRFIGVATPTGACPGQQPMLCIPETNPAARTRHAGALRARHALSETLSLGAGYRFYTDDWSVLSHTAEVDLGWSPDANTVLSLRYRFYLQSAAGHYRAVFPALRPGRQQFYTRDKELSAFSVHRVGLEGERVFALDSAGTRLRASLLLGWNSYIYSNFPLVPRITAYESTLALGVEL